MTCERLLAAEVRKLRMEIVSLKEQRFWLLNHDNSKVNSEADLVAAMKVLHPLKNPASIGNEVDRYKAAIDWLDAKFRKMPKANAEQFEAYNVIVGVLNRSKYDPETGNEWPGKEEKNDVN